MVVSTQIFQKIRPVRLTPSGLSVYRRQSVYSEEIEQTEN